MQRAKVTITPCCLGPWSLWTASGLQLQRKDVWWEMEPKETIESTAVASKSCGTPNSCMEESLPPLSCTVGVEGEDLWSRLLSVIATNVHVECARSPSTLGNVKPLGRQRREVRVCKFALWATLTFCKLWFLLVLLSPFRLKRHSGGWLSKDSPRCVGHSHTGVGRPQLLARPQSCEETEGARAVGEDGESLGSPHLGPVRQCTFHSTDDLPVGQKLQFLSSQ